MQYMHGTRAENHGVLKKCFCKELDNRQMKYICDTTEFKSDHPSVVTLGKFDGFHRGHQKLLGEVKRLQGEGYYGIVFTIAPDNTPVLLTPHEKRDVLEKWGIDCMIRCPFIPEILSMDPETFVEDVLSRKLKAAYVVVGTDFRFGHNRSGDVSLLEKLQDKYDYKLVVVEKECYGKREISSTFIKEALSDSQMELVQELLGFPYPIHGVIQHGKQLGRRIGMPTINMIPEQRKLLPPEGVYYSEVQTENLNCNGITNIGYKPTVDGSFLGVETYLYGVNENLYGQEARVSISTFCRHEKKFASVEALKAQMEQDIRSGEEYFSAK